MTDETRERIERIAEQYFDAEMDPAGLRECKAALTQLAEEERREREKLKTAILSELEYLPSASIVRESLIRLLNQPPS